MYKEKVLMKALGQFLLTVLMWLAIMLVVIALVVWILWALRDMIQGSTTVPQMIWYAFLALILTGLCAGFVSD